ncbi:MAG: UDP-N-acetylmuramoyl-L-alanyl-D-glutamate--2,6-diaminopimelate ligase, partial [Nocardioidaceae bacterium]|nr:UDP-N-acetylmuramoyl-L-alanyl-D-glutamate--2,6-diaminopimelate ligase [Nocardioidaceae bacterium]
HALVLGRVDGVVFDVAVFLNFGRDHLDFHPDVEHYFAAKASLFSPERARRGLLNVDDPAVAALVGRLDIPVRTFSPSGGPADWRSTGVTLRADGSDFELDGPHGLRTRVSTRLPGEFNVANALAVLASVGEAGLDVRSAAAGLAGIGAVPGRLEPVDEGQPFTLVVDYSHKPDAVTAALGAMRAVTTGRLWIVLGAGGDRDHGKRALMGDAAARLADVVVVTDDNPRSEDPALIRAALLAGARGARDDAGSAEVLEIADRREAIERAVSAARAGDTVVIAGKGHETGQEVAGQVIAFDDRAVAREALTRLAGKGLS